jgi:hypothetical protein
MFSIEKIYKIKLSSKKKKKMKNEKEIKFLDLHKYCIILIFSKIKIEDVGNLRRVCKKINQYFELESIWEKMTTRDFKNIFLERELFKSWEDTYRYHYMVKK